MGIKSTVLALTTAATLALTACGGSGSADGTTDKPIRPYSGPCTQDDPCVEGEGVLPGVQALGETYQGQRGTITVSARPWTPPKWQGWPGYKSFVIVDLTVKNQSTTVLDGDDWSTEVAADGRSATGIYGDDVDPVDVLPGQTGSWTEEFAIRADQLDELTVSVAWGFTEPLYWTGRI